MAELVRWGALCHSRLVSTLSARQWRTDFFRAIDNQPACDCECGCNRDRRLGSASVCPLCTALSLLALRTKTHRRLAEGTSCAHQALT